MKNKTILSITLATLGLAIIIFFISIELKKNNNKPIKINPEFSNYISAYTSGIISVKSNIRIVLTNPITEKIEPDQLIEENLFSFHPAIKGKAYWIDNRTIEFRPNKVLPYGFIYNPKFLLNKIIDVPDKLEVFKFQFQTSHQQLKIQSTNLQPYSNDNLVLNKFKAIISATDFIDNEVLEKMLSVELNRDALELLWEHNNNKHQHTFYVENVKRLEEAGELKIMINGSLVKIEDTEEIVEIPSISNFKLMQITAVQIPNQHILLRFSDPILKTQDLRGLIRIVGENNLQLQIDGNEIRAYTPERFNGSKEIIVEQGIQNVNGYKLKKQFTQELTFEAVKPQFRLIGKGVIMPDSKNLKIPFETVNLSAVDIRVIKIFENNILNFLQTSKLDRDIRLRQVGRLILKKKIELISSNAIDYGQWNAFSFDLSELIDTDPGSIYRVEISAKKSYSLYPCENSNSTDEEITEDWDSSKERENNYWDNPYGYSNYTYYDWNERNNPCHKAYYANKTVARNVLASDLGIIAKSGSDKKMVVAITNLNTTKAQSGVKVSIYNYQLQLIDKKRTNNDGLVSINFEQKPFLLVAEKGKQKGYLKLDDGSSLSLSKFDVAGRVVQKGVKGYLYGERGVWRPGDSLFVTFILEDILEKLPALHPVVFELDDPNGQTVKRMVKTQGLNGFYSFKTTTDAEAPTGNWLARVRVGGTTFTKQLRIETVKPNRLKINIDFGTDKLTVKDDKIIGKLNVKWLHGAIAKNLKARVDVKLTKVRTRFDRFKDYIFDDPASVFHAEEYTIFDDRIDNKGNAEIKAEFNLSQNVSGMLKATFLTRAFEEGGDFSIDQFSIPYAANEFYVGLKTPKGDKVRGMLLTDEDHKIEIVTVDADGNPVERKNLKVNIYKVHWRWWWESGSDNLASYVGSSQHSPILSKEISTDENGMGEFTFSIKYPDWGRYLIRVTDSGGHSSGKSVYVDWPGWAGRGQRDNPGTASMLMFSSDKNKYNVGEKAKVSFPSSEGGRALISLENGSRVVDMFWVETTDKESSFEFKISEEMAPNIYVNITLVQPHKQTANDLPIRLYGVIPLYVENPATRLNPKIEMPKKLRSEEAFELTVKEDQGKAMTYTVAIVDEGILDLTRFKTPDPWKTFYSKEALGVKTWDLYDFVLGAYGGQIQQVFAIGGDEDLTNNDKKKANRFKPVVKFIGPFTLQKNKSNTHQIQLPKYIGAVRTMVVAGQSGAYGFAQQSTPIKNPLMLLATMPRVVGPNEKLKLPVTLFAMEEDIKEVKVKVESNELFKVIGEQEQTIKVNEVGEFELNFDIEVSKNLGIGKLKILAFSGSEKTDYDIEIDIRAANPPITETYAGIVRPGEEWELDTKVFGLEGTNEATLEVSKIPPIDFGRRLKYLISYPHGCIEQTTSAVFPQLYLSAVMEVKPEMKDKTQKNIEAALNRYISFQTAEGGFSYWPGGNTSNDWGSSYAGHFMIEAEVKGYSLPIGLKSKWLAYQSRKARNWSSLFKWSYLDQAYRLYTLALAGKAEIGAMNRLRESTKLSIQAKWRLAAAYALAGKENIAIKMITSLSWDLPEYREQSNTFGSTTRDQAMILETLTILNKREIAIPLMEKISKKLSARNWMSTQTTAYSLMAMAKFAGDLDVTENLLKFSYSFNGESDEINTDKSIKQFQSKLAKKESIFSKVKNNGSSMLYINLSIEGTPIENKLPAENNNLTMDIKYKTLDNRPINITSIDQGTDFKAIITVKNPGMMGDYQEIALTQIFPSGWEILNTRMLGVGTTHDIDKPTYKDIRDDRVYSYFNLISRKSKSFVVLLNAAYVGKFYLPSVVCETMYDNRINSRSKGQWVEIVKEK